jgi:8-oxo-dGTP pyrophosphatase MutT (NUDIX family)
MRRGRHVLAVIQDKSGNYYLGAKDIYPKGITRLIGGGINSSEDPKDGMLRELEEETGIVCTKKDLDQIAEITVSSTDRNDRSFDFTTYLYAAVVDPKRLTPRGDLDDIKKLTPAEFKALMKKYADLPNKLVHLSKIPGTEFRWSDYGKFYGQVHQIAYDLTQVS